MTIIALVYVVAGVAALAYVLRTVFGMGWR
jgi:hypothetical protein